MKINIEDLSFSRKKDFAISDLSLQIEQGKMTTLVGPNGSGKSTILRLIMRLLEPKSGCVLLDGINVASISSKKLAKEMTMLSQSPDGLLDVVVHDLIAYGRMPHKSFLSTGISDEDEAVIKWALTVCNLEELAYRPLHTLSGGERQRAWLGMALAQKTPVLLLDEPTTYLDIAHQLELLDLLTKLNRDYGMTIVLVLHDLNQAALYSDQIFACQDGRIVKTGTPHEVFTKELLADVFHIKAEISEAYGRLSIQPVASTRFSS
ncbi:ABC transporter ATP-binding protein [Listeria fleischmannii]|jgi:iron complex transport system ATP-binding protein|uniref:Iron ABC transporter ATP-binding protein n=2 Tax=Listeria fleischmannii TaxID=1069827 RepID=W7DVY2_9LIST|nr:ABC transporter ATP-binding protein [Listeria fleischmannii]EIA21606.1 iron compound ABC transporter ATP-binding protein [Listeria fleischmannii subsp. coloradonensis]EUJ52256.1 iron ABC transporter ATP-binding protein [Listeria fleischmannii FSL S10-1203]MBC1398718.1 ABC transporter ATP-binding protein [Listeria fleischmannii]MBC1418165.1 ABC transporter ATP-binding protein [Listeria fleischmannii]MBC1426938.1 ABC transporter ATP-binding protein [Listeria fleischmannii]